MNPEVEDLDYAGGCVESELFLLLEPCLVLIMTKWLAIGGDDVASVFPTSRLVVVFSAVGEVVLEHGLRLEALIWERFLFL